MKDVALWLFGTVAVACLIVSAPATYRLVSIFHDGATYYGVVATFALVLILEVGTVAAKVATLFVGGGRRALNVFCAAGLTVNAVSNFIAGSEAAAPTLSGATLYVGSFVYAALVPVLAYVMLSQFVHRVDVLRGRTSSVAERVALSLRPVQEAAEVYTQMLAVIRTLQSESAPRQAMVQPSTPAPLLDVAPVDTLDTSPSNDVGTLDIVRLRDVDNLSFGEIGARLGVSRQAAQQRYNKMKGGQA